MDVRYDAKAENASTVATLAEYVINWPKLNEALQACSLRFVVNLPEASLRDAARLCFELQEAFWFYLDHLYEGAKPQRTLPKLNQMSFIQLILEFSDVLRSIYQTPKERQQLLHDWREYCRKVPLKGAVLLNERLDKCLMVQPWKGDRWTYPRGKIHEGESEAECAIREVWEETGIDVKHLIDVGEFVRADVYGTGCPVKLFLVPDIPEKVDCAPNTRKEISKIGWIALSNLPGWTPGPTADANLRTICVEPFVPEIRNWVEARRALIAAGKAPPKRRPPNGNAAASTAPAAAGGRGPADGPAGLGKAVPKPPPPAFGGRQVGATVPRSAAPEVPPPPRGGRWRCDVPPGKGAAGGVEAPPFVLDMTRVMRAFDRGWDRASRDCGGPRPAS